MPRYLFPALINAPQPSSASLSPVDIQPDWCITPLEKTFPHILEKIQTLWGYPEMELYFARLAIDDRGHRAGFPADVWDDLLMLMQLHHDLLLKR